MSSCNKCQASIIWDKPFVSGSRPKNPDNTLHECMNHSPKQEATTAQASKPTEAKSPNSILEECLEFEQTFKDLTDAKFDSLVRLYNTRVMQK